MCLELPDLCRLEGLESRTTELAPIVPRFFVPPLEDKPQNPIMDSIKSLASLYSSPFTHPVLPASDQLHALPGLATADSGTLWSDMSKLEPRANMSQILSWDRLRPSHSRRASSTPFLSEQDTSVFSYARCTVQPELYDPSTNVAHVKHEQLLASIKMTVLGTTSSLHVWDTLTETFTTIGSKDGKRGLLIIDGRDEVISNSFICRFITIGTLLRRLETLLATLHAKSIKEGPTIHAFAHTLSTILTYLRNSLVHCPPSLEDSATPNPHLTAIWMQYAIYEDALIALSDFYGRNIDLSPDEYPPLESSPVPLLSRIYKHLDLHLERQSPRLVRALFAYIISNASCGYLDKILRSVGYGVETVEGTSQVGGKRDQYNIDDEEDEEEGKENIFEMLEQIDDSFPSFFPPNLSSALPAAQKSLILLRTAEPNHPLLKTTEKMSRILWKWSVSSIEEAYQRTILPDSIVTTPPAMSSKAELFYPSTYEPELAEFQVFDLEPGSSTAKPLLKIQDDSTQNLQQFINDFPPFLPAITPTLSHLTCLVFDDLMQRASTLSSALLSIFITPSTGNLNFHSHLILLRSYLLLTAPSFKSRLCAALFSDGGDNTADNKAHSMSIRSLQQKSGHVHKRGSQSWAVGLAPSLLERETWPPVGADLSFFLRTVIVDSIELNPDGENRNMVAEEAGWRLGFAIRDLPLGPGRDKWLNPLHIEALDFLYMDYKPPHPLEILITPEVISKYQRLFAFILRLMRVDNAVKSLYRMTRSSSRPLFPTLTVSSKRLLHFRFIAQSLVSNLSGYVFDTAISGNFDLFLARTACSDVSTNASFSDVFELAQAHSSLLDDILNACLLRSGQRAVGDLLRQSLEIVLEFTIVVGELSRGRVEEYQTAPVVEDLFQKFRVNVITLIKVLKGLADKNPSLTEHISGGERKAPRGADALYHLLVRLDLTDWWSTQSR